MSGNRRAEEAASNADRAVARRDRRIAELEEKLRRAQEALLAVEAKLITHFCEDENTCEDPECEAVEWTRPIRAAMAAIAKAEGRS